MSPLEADHYQRQQDAEMDMIDDLAEQCYEDIKTYTDEIDGFNDAWDNVIYQREMTGRHINLDSVKSQVQAIVEKWFSE